MKLVPERVTMKDAIVYCRFSPRPDADTCTSCEKQFDRCQTFAVARHLRVLYWFHDDGISGDAVVSRPALQQALQALKPGYVLLVDTIDRLARDSLAYLTIQAEVTSLGAEIVFADGSPPSSTPEGVLFQSIVAAVATYQRAVTKRRTSVGVKKALQQRKDEGKHQGKPPFGWMSVNGVLCHSLREQAILDDIKSLNDQDCISKPLSPEEIARRINDAWGGLRTKPATAASIRKLIRKYIK